MNPLDIIFEYYPKGSQLADILVRHSRLVRDKALAVADNVPHLTPDKIFIEQAAMLHDIGIVQTASARIGCHGKHPYLCHGIIGRQMLEELDLKTHGLVCERHVGAGISKTDIQKHQLPLPCRDMLPTTIEEIIICYADKFFSKTNNSACHSVDAVVAGLKRFGSDKVQRFMHWHRMFTA